MKLILFDIDGTILWTDGAGRRAIGRALLEELGTAGPIDAYRLDGKTDPQIVRELVEESVGKERCEASLEKALERYLAELSRRLSPELVKPKPGVPELLARLAAEPRVALGLLTGNLERGARMKLEPPGFNPYFSFGAFGSDCADRYLLPAIAVERARERCGRVFADKSIVVVGDSVHDVACGRMLNVRSVAVATGPTPAERLAAEGPDALLASFADVEAGLRAILG